MKNLLFLDTETTGLGDTDRIVQIATKFVGDSFTGIFYVKPPVPISFEAMATHHITREKVEYEPPFSEIAKEIQEAINDRIVVAHNAEFDIGMLKREGIEVGEYICTKKVAQHLFDEESYRLQYLRYKYDLRVDGEAHSAEGDVAVLEALFYFLYQQISIEKMIDISKRPVLLRRIGFGKHKGTEFAKIPMDYMQWLAKQTDLEPDLVYTLNHYLSTP